VHFTHVSDDTSAVQFPSTATYECDHGYVLSSISPRQCQPDGSWSGREVTCDAIVCEALPRLANGETFYSHHRAYGSSVTFTCDDWYELEPLAKIEGSIHCGHTVTGSTRGAESVHGEAAGEHIYHFSIPPDSAQHTISFDSCLSKFAAIVRVTTLDLKEEFFVGEDRPGAECDDPRHEPTLAFSGLRGGEYALTVEGRGSDEGAYQLSMACSSVGTVCRTGCNHPGSAPDHRCFELAQSCPRSEAVALLPPCDDADLHVGDLRGAGLLRTHGSQGGRRPAPLLARRFLHPLPVEKACILLSVPRRPPPPPPPERSGPRKKETNWTSGEIKKFTV
jgi:hypothetical protein